MFLSFGNTKTIFRADAKASLAKGESSAPRRHEVDAGSLRQRLHGTIHQVQISRSPLAIAWRMLQGALDGQW